MKVQPSLFLVGTLALAACAPETESAPETAPATEMSTDEAALDEVRADYASLYNAGDAAGVADLFTDSAYGLWADGVVTMGREAILADVREDLEGSPTLELATEESLFFGDNAVAHGRYTVSTTSGEAPMTFAGHYLTHFVREDGEWRINGVITNFEAPPPEGVAADEIEGEEPPEEGTMKEFTTAYADAMQASDWTAIASMYADDAVAAFSNTPAVRGSADIAARFAERFGETTPTMEIHDVGTLDLGNDHVLDGGWYRLTATLPEGAIEQAGTYLSLVQRQPDGSWKIRWQVTNGQTRPAN